MKWDQVITELRTEISIWEEVEEWIKVEKTQIEEERRIEEQRNRWFERKRAEIQERRIALEKKRVKCRRCGLQGHRAYECVKTPDWVVKEKRENGEMVIKKIRGDGREDRENEKEKGKEVANKIREKTEEEFKQLKANSNEERGKMRIEELIREFPKVLDSEKKPIEFCEIEKCKIKTEPGKKIVRKGQRIPQAIKEKVKIYLDDLERRGIISRSDSEWRNPVRALEKPDGGVRFVENLMGLNDLVEKDPYELRNIQEIINATQGSKCFSVVDLKEGFYYIAIEEKDRHKTAFEVDGNVWHWNGMVMGYKNSPQIMQRVMNKIIGELRGKGVEVYMDDIIIHAKEREKHNWLVKEVMKRLEMNKMRVNPRKLQLGLKEVKILGVTIDGENKRPSEIKRNEALEYPQPTNVSELRRFLGLSGWFRDFIKDYAEKTKELTNALRKNSNLKFKWTEEMNKGFEGMKICLRDMRELQLPDYNKEFMLRTDASGTGIGAVLLQKNKIGEWAPIQWASKKLTDAERKYGITEKEMLAVFWAVKKFEYELRGRKFQLVSDHKALEEIRSKAEFNNARVNRWIDQIQEFDFEIKYNKGEELAVPDALSRLYEKETEKEIKRKERGLKMLEGKAKKHVIEENNQKYWQFDSGKRAIIPEIEQRKSLVEKAHVELEHRAADAVYYELKKTYYWPGMKETVANVTRKCEVCLKYNRKKSGGSEFVPTSRIMEKVALDLIDVRSEGKYVLVAIDYYSRAIRAKVMDNKKTETVVKTLNEWIKTWNKIEELITDNGKEFCSEMFRDFCKEMNIEHRRVGVESHRSNGRVERAIGSIKEGLIKKEGNSDLGKKVSDVVRSYNETYHSGIRCTPIEAWTEDCERIRIENSEGSKYAGKFKKGFREKFEVNEKVLVAQHENLKDKPKEFKGRFTKEGTVVEKMENDSYLVKLAKDGKLVKKRHNDLKSCAGSRVENKVKETTRLEAGMLSLFK